MSGRKPSPEYQKALDLFFDSDGAMPLIEIASRVGKSDGQIRKWKSEKGWDALLGERRAKGNVTKSNSNVTKSDVPEERGTSPPDSEVSWVKIETEYVTDVRRKPYTLKDLAEKHGVPFDTITKHAKKHGWTEKRRTHCERVARETVEKAADLLSDDVSRFLVRHLRTTSRLLDLVEEALDNPDEPFTYVEKVKRGTSEIIIQEKKGALNTSRLLQLMQIAEKAQKLQRQTLGILDPKESAIVEKTRVEIDNAKGNSKDVSTVVFVEDLDD